MSSLLNRKEPKLPALSDLKQIELDQSLLWQIELNKYLLNKERTIIIEIERQLRSFA